MKAENEHAVTYNLRPAWRYEWFQFVKALFGCGIYLAPLEHLSLAQIGIQPSELNVPDNVFWYVKIMGAVFAVWSLLKALISHYRHKYHIGVTGVESRYGIIARDERRAEYSNISYVRLSQSVMQRLFGVGSVLIGTSATDEPEVVLYGVSNPSRWKRVLHERQG